MKSYAPDIEIQMQRYYQSLSEKDRRRYAAKLTIIQIYSFYPSVKGLPKLIYANQKSDSLLNLNSYHYYATPIFNGRRTITLEAFYAEVSQVLLAEQPWGKKLGALHEVLRGDYGLLPKTFWLLW